MPHVVLPLTWCGLSSSANASTSGLRSILEIHRGEGGRGRGAWRSDVCLLTEWACNRVCGLACECTHRRALCPWRLPGPMPLCPFAWCFRALADGLVSVLVAPCATRAPHVRALALLKPGTQLHSWPRAQLDCAHDSSCMICLSHGAPSPLCSQAGA